MLRTPQLSHAPFTRARAGLAALDELRRALRFALVGALSTLVDISLLTLLTQAAGLATLPANVASYGTGILVNFALNRRWTFRAARGKRAGLQLAQFTAISLVGLALNTALVVVLAGPCAGLIGAAGGTLLAKLVATGAVFGWNFTANRLWTFGDAASDTAASGAAAPVTRS